MLRGRRVAVSMSRGTQLSTVTFLYRACPFYCINPSLEIPCERLRYASSGILDIFEYINTIMSG
jgi:hypothetical protein